jgi:phosphoribosyl-AMP cyclohydrolase
MEVLKDSLTLIKQDLVTKKIVSVENTSKESIEKLASKQENLLTDCDLDSILWTGNFELATLQKLTSSGHLSFPSLLPVVTLDLEQKVLMQAFVNTTALSETFRTGFANYFSRSRNKIWLKGESSDNRQEIVDVYNSVGKFFFLFM